MTTEELIAGLQKGMRICWMDWDYANGHTVRNTYANIAVLTEEEAVRAEERLFRAPDNIIDSAMRQLFPVGNFIDYNDLMEMFDEQFGSEDESEEKLAAEQDEAPPPIIDHK